MYFFFLYIKKDYWASMSLKLVSSGRKCIPKKPLYRAEINPIKGQTTQYSLYESEIWLCIWIICIIKLYSSSNIICLNHKMYNVFHYSYLVQFITYFTELNLLLEILIIVVETKRTKYNKC